MVELKNYLVLIIGIILVLINNYLGHVDPPFSIDWTPFLIGLITFCIFIFINFRLIFKFSLVTGFIVVNDILVKLFSGGDHDAEGSAWIFFSLFAGLILSTVIIALYGIINPSKNKKEYFRYLLGFFVLIFIYSNIFDSMGQVNFNYPSEQIEESKENGLFISELNFSEDKVIIGNDTIKFKQGWVEKRFLSHDFGIFKKKDFTSNNNYVILLTAKFNKYDYNDSIQWKVNDTSEYGSNFLYSRLTFTIDKTKNEVELSFFKNNDNPIKKIIKIKTGNK